MSDATTSRWLSRLNLEGRQKIIHKAYEKIATDWHVKGLNHIGLWKPEDNQSFSFKTRDSKYSWLVSIEFSEMNNLINNRIEVKRAIYIDRDTQNGIPKNTATISKLVLTEWYSVDDLTSDLAELITRYVLDEFSDLGIMEIKPVTNHFNFLPSMERL